MKVQQKHDALEAKQKKVKDLKEEKDLRGKLRAYFKENEKAIIESLREENLDY